MRPYFYIIQHIETKKYYVGYRSNKNMKENELLVAGGYPTSSNTIKSLLNENEKSFIIRKLKFFDTGDEAYNYETKFLRKVKARTNKNFYNGHENDNLLPSYGTEKYKEFMIQKYGVDNPSKSQEIMSKILSTKSTNEWKQTKGKNSTKKRLETVLSPEWKETVGKKTIEKRLQNTNQTSKGISISKTMNDPEWKKTVGKNSTKKRLETFDYEKSGKNISKTKSSTEWKENQGVKANLKRSETMNDPEWKATIGSQGHLKRLETFDYEKSGKNISKTRNDPDWQKLHRKVCPHCGISCLPPGFVRFHGNKCKHKNGLVGVYSPTKVSLSSFCIFDS